MLDFWFIFQNGYLVSTVISINQPFKLSYGYYCLPVNGNRYDLTSNHWNYKNIKYILYHYSLVISSFKIVVHTYEKKLIFARLERCEHLIKTGLPKHNMSSWIYFIEFYIFHCKMNTNYHVLQLRTRHTLYNIVYIILFYIEYFGHIYIIIIYFIHWWDYGEFMAKLAVQINDIDKINGHWFWRWYIKARELLSKTVRMTWNVYIGMS